MDDQVKSPAATDLAEPGADVERLVEILSQWNRDRAVIGRFFHSLGSVGLLRMIDRGVLSVPNSEREIGLQFRLMEALRDGLRVATRTAGFPCGEFAGALVERATGKAEGGELPATALALLLTDSFFANEFLVVVAKDLDRYERVTMRGTRRLWGRTIRQGTELGSFLIGGDTDIVRGMDPMAALMTALRRSPAVAYEFFDDDDAQRIPYYRDVRRWDSHGREALSAAVSAASTHGSSNRGAL